jgi:hypothetical protein
MDFRRTGNQVFSSDSIDSKTFKTAIRDARPMRAAQLSYQTGDGIGPAKRELIVGR